MTLSLNAVFKDARHQLALTLVSPLLLVCLAMLRKDSFMTPPLPLANALMEIILTTTSGSNVSPARPNFVLPALLQGQLSALRALLVLLSILSTACAHVQWGSSRVMPLAIGAQRGVLLAQ